MPRAVWHKTRMGKLLACPFCRELFTEGEVERCPHCDIPLSDLAKLPLSSEAAELDELGLLDSPFDRRLPFTYWRRGRGLLLGASLLGLASFFLPWVSLLRPDPVLLSGFDLARGNARWLFGGALGWFLLIAVVLSRRSVNEMRGARAIAVTFPLMTVFEIVLMLVRPPSENEVFTSGLSFAPAFYGSLILALLGVGAGLRFGGNPEDFSDLVNPLAPSPRRPGETVH
jgi:hypothetical protein